MSKTSLREALLSDPEQAEILAQLLKKQISDNLRRYPLSFAQRRLWLLHQMEEHSPAYNVPLALHIQGELNLNALESALTEVIRRHGVLRTTFGADDAWEPWQRVEPARLFALDLADLAVIPESETEQRLTEYINTEVGRQFNLATGPVVRGKLLAKSESDHSLLIVLHHIVSDGWSTAVLTAEVTALYEASVQGRQFSLPEPKLQYVDYANWQIKRSAGKQSKQQIEYWKHRLQAPLPITDLSPRSPRPAVRSGRGATITRFVDLRRCEGLRRLCHNEGVTLFMALLAVFEVLINRYTSQEDIIVGTPVSNRNRSEFESLIGPFINTLVLRLDLSDDPKFVDVLARTKETALGAYANQDVPFEVLVDEIVQVRDPGRTPLFQVMFVLQNSPGQEARFAGLTISPLALETETAKFDLTVSLIETAGGITAAWEYSTDLFDEAFVGQLAAHYRRLVDCAAKDPLQRISQMAMLSEGEIQQLISPPASDYKQGHTEDSLVALFENQAARRPEAVAVIFEEEYLSYGSVNRRSNLLARRLIELGAEPESRVGLLMDRGGELVTAIIGILKAGAAYVPLDPSYPVDRVNHVLRDARIRILVTQDESGGRFRSACVQCDVVSMESIGSRDSSTASTSPGRRATGENLAYIIYTSGSTGKPKGVAVEHSQVMRLFGATENWYGFDENDVWMLFHSFAFDFSVWEIWGALLYGGRLVLVPYVTSRSPDLVCGLISEQRTTVLNQTPSAFRGLIQCFADQPVPSTMPLRYVIFGGEALDLEMLRPWFARHGDRAPRLINMYGITETTVHVTYRPIAEEDAAGASGSVIGQPIPDLGLYLTGPRLEPMPLEATGEIYIGGAGLARGYFDNAQLTAGKFVPDAFGMTAGSRLYKTGDAARRLRSGDVQYLGRIDNQVKIRGFRIELGEIEACLSALPSIKAAVVIAKADNVDDTRLVAYIVPEREVRHSSAELRARLRENLPDYMIPSSFVYLEALPLTPTGKLDRKALPDRKEDPKAGGEFIGPRDLVEFEIVRVWEDVLRNGPVSVTDDFFESGGHSLLAVRLVAQLRAKLGYEIPLSAVIQNPSVESLAHYVREFATGAFSPLVAIQPAGSRQPLFCVHPIGGNVLCYVELSRELGVGLPVYALQSFGLSEELEPAASIEQMAASYIEAIFEVQAAGPFRLAGWSFGGVVAVEMARQLREARQDVDVVFLIDSWAPGSIGGDILSNIHADGRALLSAFLSDLTGLSGRQVPTTLEGVQSDDAESALKDFLVSASDDGLFPEDMDLSRLERLYRVFKSNVKALANFRPKQKLLPERTILFRASEPTAGPASDPAYGWREWDGGPELIVHDMPAAHYNILRGPNAGILASFLEQYL